MVNYGYRTEMIRKDVEKVGNGEIWTEIVSETGVVRTRQVTAGPWVENRSDCYCCSCVNEDQRDFYCRNHGYMGRRACEIHNMPATVQGLSSVQALIKQYK